MVVSEPERLILDALVISPDLPKIQDRAAVVLKAADGLADEEIAASLMMRRKDVLHWRKRFEAHGIRGLWDKAGPGPQLHVTPEKEAAIVKDALFSGMGLPRTPKWLALEHQLNRAAVQRTFVKHGIVFQNLAGLINIDQLKVFADPLFGVTVSCIAGLYYGGCGMLALSCNAEPFSDLRLLSGVAVSEPFDQFLQELQDLAAFRQANIMTIAGLASFEELLFLEWLDKIEVCREPNSQIHLLADWPHHPPQARPSFKNWLANHPRVAISYAPMVTNLFWFTLVQRCFSIIAALPVQASFIAGVRGLTEQITHFSQADQLCIIRLTAVKA